MGMKRRFLKTFSIAVIVGLLYGFTSVWLQAICINRGIHFYMRIDVAIDLLHLLAGNTVLIYGFFAAFLLFIISDVHKFKGKGYKMYKKLIDDKMNLFVWLTGLVVDFFFFLIWSLYALERQKHVGDVFFDLPTVAPAYVIYFMLIISLLGYLVFSLVVGAFDAGGDHVEGDQ